jgi:hypothetical protein
MGMLAGGADIVQLEERSKRACKKAAFNGARSKAGIGMAAASARSELYSLALSALR